MQTEFIDHIGECSADGDWFFHEEIQLLFELQRLILNFLYITYIFFNHWCLSRQFNVSCLIFVESITGTGSRKAVILCNSCVDVKESQDSATGVADANDRYGLIGVFSLRLLVHLYNILFFSFVCVTMAAEL